MKMGMREGRGAGIDVVEFSCFLAREESTKLPGCQLAIETCASEFGH